MDYQPQPDMWPLRRGDTLSNHDWFPFYTHRFLSSRFLAAAVMEKRRGDIGTAVILWSESMRQDPAGTLPDCDVELASLARFATVEDWQAVKAGVMHGWVPVLVEDDRSGDVITRLGHPGFMQGIVEEMHKRKRGRDGAREAARLAVRKSRIRKKMADLNIQDHIIKDDRAVGMLAEHFEHSDLYVTPDNLRAAMTEVLGYTGEVAHFPNRRGG
ncbi:hypothetical protein TG4357_03727 [Thalassovita gelatinovora]|uniref:Uncharacterized protein n=1 Tax=Thalassovita gelatinovora TaxID=53501 RepID=A0A0N7LWB9_THAGE|nr:hypothetical protein [Thalassovita gelatinovora]QIZ79061.1 hypothetical protein HFZ77_00510 [Thalassovita gelatinovora]CUH68666.1 hypothetical protein TG4357_03727 [Thalassovita gelatinovora]SEQ56362.1 hypothetical protein SAMN04488043_106188 [Thalassovita gelatinovora]